jgi:hypothetical protein
MERPIMKYRGKLKVTCVAALAVLVTGCPRDEYVVELTPRPDGIERKLTFYRADGVNSNGVPNYQAFDTNELAVITRLYPPGAVKHSGDRHTATGVFGKAMPADVGGAGSFTNISSSLGSASFYLERFRGNDDLAAQNARRMRAADQLTDLILGWSRRELGREARYADLRRFLDVDFRVDLKNLSLHAWMMEATPGEKSRNEEEMGIRFGQYLAERGYLSGDQLQQYCLWRAGLSFAQAAEWDALLTSLRPGAELRKKLDAFRFSNEAPPTASGSTQSQVTSASEFGRQLILSTFPEPAGETEK